MKFGPFTTCLTYNELATGTTGSIVGVYDFASGLSGVVFNQFYSSGNHFSGSNIYGPITPLISVGKFNVVNTQFTGVNAYRFGYSTSGDFGVLFDIDYSGCSRNTTGVSYVLFSTANNATGGLKDTFYLGINDLNRIFLETSGYSKTLPYELKSKNIVFVGLGNQQFVEFGVFDYLNQRVVSEAVNLPNQQKSVNSLYIGGFLNETSKGYTGYFGKITNVVLSNKPIESTGVAICSNCLYVTGVTSGNPTVTKVVIPQVSGYLLSGVSGSVVTGTSSYTETITRADNSTVSIVFPSGITGLQQISQIATVLTGTVTVNVTGKTPLTFSKDFNSIKDYMQYDVEFDLALASGDFLEIYTFPDYKPYLNQPVVDLDYPSSGSKFVQILGNGLMETKDVDYYVVRNEISGFFPEDILRYDLYDDVPFVTGFSGYWTEDKIQMSGGGYFPPTGQFNESLGTINITGVIQGFFDFHYDIYMNGQKLRSGVHYSLEEEFSWGFPNPGKVFIKLNPSYVPRLSAEKLYHPTGGLPTGIGEVEDAELMIVKRITPYNLYSGEATGDLSIYTGVSGFSEIVWVNGVRQTINVDYVKNFTCSQASGIVDPPSTSFNFYNNETGYFNIS